MVTLAWTTIQMWSNSQMDMLVPGVRHVYGYLVQRS